MGIPLSLLFALVSILWTMAVTLYAIRYVRRAEEVERRGVDLEDAVRAQRGEDDVTLAVRPAWRIYLRDSDGVAHEAHVEDFEVPVDELARRALEQLSKERTSMIIRRALRPPLGLVLDDDTTCGDSA